MPFLDILNDIERSGICRREFWFELRDIRNTLAHEYSDELERHCESVNSLIRLLPKMISVQQNLKEAETV